MKKKWVYTVLALGLLALAGCNNKQGDNGTMATATPIPTETPTPTPFVPEILGVFEAERATLAGNVKIITDYVEGFINTDSDSCTFTVDMYPESWTH